ncbi:NineTeen Complex (NTC) component [Puccinia graminis f. sp. tritici]|uniref:NineTeen Complex (NTC) component n=1 Tax=Puccinia graminis f. sp. tritici TaxID=56615 RepID=A0A5B0PLR6_PUCGR|nr:NineTeen Complex (NTC) component [Puccinia graminis f. sp. tritici]KAA1116884.1 NineTeen Complex (NTC) component [Puccinia graminis f. sp. tritici]
MPEGKKELILPRWLPRHLNAPIIAGLTDYEVRDLNDEINKLLREKGHWENQIINLGGANYRRIGSSTFDGAGRSAPGQRGYKYFGRAKELPGVKELFEGASKQQEELDGLKKTDDVYQMFKNQGPSYFGDLDEYGAEGEQLLKYESAHERQDWEDTFESISALLGLPAGESNIPPFPTASNEVDLSSHLATEPKAHQTSAIRDKRKADDDPPGTPSKKKTTNLDEGGIASQQDKQAIPDPTDSSDQPDQTQAAPKPPLSIFDPADLKPPPVPTIEQWEQMIIQLQKAALLKEYIG